MFFGAILRLLLFLFSIDEIHTLLLYHIGALVIYSFAKTHGLANNFERLLQFKPYRSS